MAITEINVINLGLVLVGAKTIASTSVDTKAARLAGDMFEFSRNGMMELPVHWKFLTARAQLSQLGEPAFGQYDYQYKLPNKCLKVIANVNEDDDTQEYAFRREAYVYTEGNTEKEADVIQTETETCYIKYIRLREDAGCWPAWFARLVALDLAILLCEPLKQDKQKKNQLLTMMIEPNYGWLALAEQANAMEDMDASDVDVNLYRGNMDVLDAPTVDIVRKRYIQVVET